MKMFQKDVFPWNFAGGFAVADRGWTSRRGGGDLSYYDRPVAEGAAAPANRACRAKCAPRPAPNSASARPQGSDLCAIIVGPSAKGGKRPKGIEVVPINSVDQF